MRWSHGTSELRELIECWAQAEITGEGAKPVTQVVAESHRRRLIRLEDAQGDALLLKIHRLATGRHALRDGLKRRFGRSAAEREWRTLRRVHAVGLPAPEPLGRARLASGDELLVERFVEGRLLRDFLADSTVDARPALLATARAAHALHCNGLAHGDLHAGNILVGEKGPVLLDWQSARPCRAVTDRAALHDLAVLDASLAQLGVARSLRRLVSLAGLGSLESDSISARRLLAELERGSLRASIRHARNLTRRSLRPESGGAAWRTDAGHGMRRPDTDEATLKEALEAHRAALGAGSSEVLKSDERSRITRIQAAGRDWVIKEVHRGGLPRALGDRLRGGPARRAWRAATGLRARGILCAEPLAWFESPPLATSRWALLMMEPLGEWTANDPALFEHVTPEAFVDTLTELVISLHRSHVWHADLKAGNVRLVRHAGDWIAAPVDLEDVRFPNRLSAQRRMQNLAQLNASLPEALVRAPLRERAFARYVAALPFDAGDEAARARIIELSLRRRHVWRGGDCDVSAQSPSG